MSNIAGRILDGRNISDERILMQDQRLFLDEYAIFDRVINVLFIREDGSTVTIRSDYEMQDYGNGYFFRKCSQKPALKIQYKQVTQNTAISIRLWVSNLHMQSAYNDETFKKETAVNNPIKRAIIQIGYINQFPRFTDQSLGLGKNDFLYLLPLEDNDRYTTLDCMVLGVYPEKLPPDGVTLFDCVVGNNEVNFHTSMAVSDRTRTVRSSDKLSGYLFESITRRYPKGTFIGNIEVESRFRETIKADVNGTEQVFTFPGPMTVDSARRHGVKCYVTDAAEAYFAKSIGRRTELEIIPRKGTASQAIAHFVGEHTDLRVAPLVSGDYVVYSKNESPQDVFSRLRRDGAVREVSNLPAIYSITYSGIRTIKCPFTPFVQPFQEISFTSRYNIGNLVSYFYSPQQGMEKFYAISIAITFSTMDDSNEMEILSTDSGESQ